MNINHRVSSARIIFYAFAFIFLTCGKGFCDKVNLSAGSKIEIRYKRSLTTRSDKPPSTDKIFEVAAGDTIASIEIFHPGSRVFCRIIEFDKPGHLGKPGFIQLQIDSVEAVGGRNIAVVPIQLSARGQSKKLKACLFLPLLGYGYFIKGGQAALGDDGQKIITVKTARYEEIHF
jgi:hypothetical protein